MKRPPLSVARIWAESGGLERLTDYGLRFVWSFPEIATAVLDMSSLYEVAESVTLCDRAEPDHVTIQEDIDQPREGCISQIEANSLLFLSPLHALSRGD